MDDRHFEKSVNDLVASHVLREVALLVLGGCTLLAWCKNRKGAEENGAEVHFIPIPLCG